MIKHYFVAGQEVYEDTETSQKAKRTETPDGCPPEFGGQTPAQRAEFDMLQARYYQQLEDAGIGEAMYESDDPDDFDRVGGKPY